MIQDLLDTSTEEVAKKLVTMRESGGAVTLGRVLTLVVKTDVGEPTEGAIEAANEASREHPCRVIVVASHERDQASRLDAQIRVGGDAGASEVVVLNLFGELADHGHSVVIPFLLPDTPVVAWWPGRAPAVPAADPLGRLCQRRITDATRVEDSVAVLDERRAGYSPGDSDIAWSRITAWRAVLASALDRPPHPAITGASVRGPANVANVDLMAGWLTSTLGVPTVRAEGGFEVRIDTESGPLVLAVDQDNTAVISMPGHPPGRVVLASRDTGECLAEELRRLDPDEIYELALRGVADVRSAAAAS